MLNYPTQLAIGIIGIFSLFLVGKFFITIQRKRFRQKQKNVLLSIRASRENEKLPIVAEQVFAVLHGIIHKISFLEKLRGVNTESFSFEIANWVDAGPTKVPPKAVLQTLLNLSCACQTPETPFQEKMEMINTPREGAALTPVREWGADSLPLEGERGGGLDNRVNTETTKSNKM